MNREEILNNFIQVLTTTLRLRNFIDDDFFTNKLDGKIKNLSTIFINFLVVSVNDAAQHNLFFYKLINEIDNLSELTQELVYLNLLEPSPLFFESKKCLLSIKLKIIKNKKEVVKKESVSESKKVFFEKNKKVSTNKAIKLNKNKQKILNFIKSYPDTRTKDIINEFNALSDRTVKRNLTELLKTGIIKKRIDNKATFYSYTDL